MRSIIVQCNAKEHSGLQDKSRVEWPWGCAFLTVAHSRAPPLAPARQQQGLATLFSLLPTHFLFCNHAFSLSIAPFLNDVPSRIAWTSLLHFTKSLNFQIWQILVIFYPLSCFDFFIVISKPGWRCIKMQGWVFSKWNCNKSNDGERVGVCLIPCSETESMGRFHRQALRCTPAPAQHTTQLHICWHNFPPPHCGGSL